MVIVQATVLNTPTPRVMARIATVPGAHEPEGTA
jgi:hypothetical protein